MSGDGVAASAQSVANAGSDTGRDAGRAAANAAAADAGAAERGSGLEDFRGLLFGLEVAQHAPQVPSARARRIAAATSRAPHVVTDHNATAAAAAAGWFAASAAAVRRVVAAAAAAAAARLVVDNWGFLHPAHHQYLRFAAADDDDALPGAIVVVAAAAAAAAAVFHRFEGVTLERQGRAVVGVEQRLLEVEGRLGGLRQRRQQPALHLPHHLAELHVTLEHGWMDN